MTTIVTTNEDEFVCVTPETPQHIRLEIGHGIQSTDVVLTLSQAALLVTELEKLLAVDEDEDV